jgi:hypothetical protein
VVTFYGWGERETTMHTERNKALEWAILVIVLLFVLWESAESERVRYKECVRTAQIADGEEAIHEALGWCAP